VRLAVAIQHHPERADLLPPLLDVLAPAYVATDPDPDAKKRMPLRSYLAALRAIPDDASHLLIVQDDVRVCRNFRAAAELVVTSRPEALVAFFVPGQPPEMCHAIACAVDRRERIIPLPCRRWVPVVALAWPADLARSFLAYQEAQRWPPSFGADDEGVGRWSREQGLEILATAPSLVQHPDDTPSLVGRRVRGGRCAAVYIGDEDDPLALAWD